MILKGYFISCDKETYHAIMRCDKKIFNISIEKDKITLPLPLDLETEYILELLENNEFKLYLNNGVCL